MTVQNSDQSENVTQQKGLEGEIRHQFGDEWEFTAHAEAKEFAQYVTAVETLADDARMTFTPETVTTDAVDPAHVGLIEDAEAPLKKSSGHLTVGVNFHKLKNELPTYYPDGHFEITIVSDDDGTSVTVWTPEGEVELRAILPEQVRSVDPPELDEFEQEFDLPAFKVAGALGKTAEACTGPIELTPKYGELQIKGTDAADESHTWTVEADAEPGDTSTYSADYLNDVCSGLALGETVTMKLGGHYPLVLESESMKYTIAPRIVDDDL